MSWLFSVTQWKKYIRIPIWNWALFEAEAIHRGLLCAAASCKLHDLLVRLDNSVLPNKSLCIAEQQWNVRASRFHTQMCTIIASKKTHVAGAEGGGWGWEWRGARGLGAGGGRGRPTVSSRDMAPLTTFNQPSVNNSTFSLFSKN